MIVKHKTHRDRDGRVFGVNSKTLHFFFEKLTTLESSSAGDA